MQQRIQSITLLLVITGITALSCKKKKTNQLLKQKQSFLLLEPGSSLPIQALLLMTGMVMGFLRLIF